MISWTLRIAIRHLSILAIMAKPTEPRWPIEEWRTWWNGRFPQQNPKEPGRSYKSGDNAGGAFSTELTDNLNKMVLDFIGTRCNQRNVGSPKLRLIAKVALWNAVQKHAEYWLIESAAECREDRISWTALSAASEYEGAASFQRRWGEKVDDAIVRRENERLAKEAKEAKEAADEAADPF
jgi:hypothetical protein